MSKKSQHKGKQAHSFAEMETEVLQLWNESKAFEKSVNMRPEDKQYVFYDGPPFATGLPHYGHIVASVMKDMVPRHWTMRGFRVERKWGWDCHGLPIENIVEKNLDLPSRKDIEAYGIDKFNEACRSCVMDYADEWKKIIPRIGRWVDMENDYKTLDRDYMESVWWVFRQLWDTDLIYQGHKAMHICPRCATPLSNFEVTQGYQDTKDIAVTAQFKLQESFDLEGDVYAIAWTTTPWTLPGNVLLAVGADIEYVVVRTKSPATEETVQVLLAKDRMEDVLGDAKYELLKELKGSDVAGTAYAPLFPYFADTENAFHVVSANFVTTEDGTGIVHIAPAFGDDDYAVGKAHDVPLVQHVNIDGSFTEEVTDFAGLVVKTKDDPMQADKKIMVWLKENGGVFKKETYKHSYPHCWRCDTPLLNYATSSWFVKVTDLKDDLLANNAEINWVPNSVKDGRFGKWLEGARDWAVSRNRFWGAPLPIWMSEDGDAICVGSVEELEELSGTKVDDLHKHIVDEVTFEKDGKEYRRVPEVLDCWFESGSMPYAQMHYPFENREKFESAFPAQFIAEGQDQTRGWFYTLHVLATALSRGEQPVIPSEKTHGAFQNVIVNGIVLAEDGKKMSKRLKNYPDPMEVVEKYGADALRLYLASSPAMEAQNLNFSEDDLSQVYRKYTNTLWNVFTMYELFVEQEEGDIALVSADEVENVLDRWVLSQLQTLVAEVTEGYDNYLLRKASLPLIDFVQELSTWYVRRSRERLKGEDATDRLMALRVLKTVLTTLSQIAAPVTPFIAEKIYQSVRGETDPSSVHHCDWPQANEAFVKEDVVATMAVVREMIEQALALRAEAGIKVRQPLASVTVEGAELSEDYQDIVKDELNVKAVRFGDAFTLDTEITEELKLEGFLREMVRQTNSLRKKAGLTISDTIDIRVHTEDEAAQKMLDTHGEEYQASVLAQSLTKADEPQEHTIKLDTDTRLTISF